MFKQHRHEPNYFIRGLTQAIKENDKQHAEAAAAYLEGTLQTYKLQGKAPEPRILIVTLEGSPGEYRFQVEYSPDFDTVLLTHLIGEGNCARID